MLPPLHAHTYLLDVVIFLRNFLGARPSRKQNYLWNKKGEALEPVVQVWNLPDGRLPGTLSSARWNRDLGPLGVSL